MLLSLKLIHADCIDFLQEIPKGGVSLKSSGDGKLPLVLW